jgi:hypothetical protein
MSAFQQVLGSIAADSDLWHEFLAFARCGGRVAGSESERRAAAIVEASLVRLPRIAVRREPIAYDGWRATAASVEVTGDPPRDIACQPLLRAAPTPPEGLVAEVVDLGRGTPEAYDAHAGEIGGRIALVRHEYMFADGTIHRRRKLGWAVERGAAGFLIANPHPGIGPVAGSAGMAGERRIPAVGIAAEGAALLSYRGPTRPTVRLRLATEESPARADNLIAELPGETDDWIVLSAHIDGHSLAESAMDNATGLAAALAVFRAMAPLAGTLRRGLRLCVFTVEEWALTGSHRHVAALGEAERRRIRLNVNLDSVAGSPRLTALTSGFAKLDGFLGEAAAQVGAELGLYRPLMANSDHYNFAAAGIPAFRLVAGFDEPGSNLRYVLTAADTADKVASGELRHAAQLVAAIVHRACTLPDGEAEWR